MEVVWEFDRFSNNCIRHIDNGVFLDGRDKALEEVGVASNTWKGARDVGKKEKTSKADGSNEKTTSRNETKNRKLERRERVHMTEHDKHTCAKCLRKCLEDNTICNDCGQDFCPRCSAWWE